MAEGRIMKALSGFYYVKSGDKMYACKGRGVFRNQNITPLVGDYVVFDHTDEGEGYIQEIKARHSELVRPPIANISQGIIVNAVTEPTFSTLLLDRFLLEIESKRIKPIIVVTKKDIATDDELEVMNAFISDYEKLGYPIYFVSLDQASKEIKPIIAHFKEEVTVLMGQSGVGKSTLLNVIKPSLQIEEGVISKSLGRGKHTTRHVELMEIHDGLVADTPGFSSLTFKTLEAEQLSDYFIEMQERKPACKFRSCLHVKEPKCAIKQAVETGEIKQYRYDNYVQFLHEIMERKPRYSND